MGATRDISCAIEELGLSGSINIGKCCKKTLRNWIQDINRKLETDNYDWRVTGLMENRTGVINAIPKERYVAITSIT